MMHSSAHTVFVNGDVTVLVFCDAGLSEWEDDRVLAAVLAASQQEYLQGLKHNSRGAESL